MITKNGLTYLLERSLSKRILFSRHAKSSWGNLGTSDQDRSLSQEGVDSAHLMGSRLLENNILPDFFMSSSAKRALDTCKIIKNEVNVDGEIQIFKQIYTDGLDGIVSSIQLADNQYNFIAIFGHNPTMHQIYNNISNTYLSKFPTSALFVCSFNSKRWESFNLSNLKIEIYDYPKNIKYNFK